MNPKKIYPIPRVKQGQGSGEVGMVSQVLPGFVFRSLPLVSYVKLPQQAVFFYFKLGGEQQVG